MEGKGITVASSYDGYCASLEYRGGVNRLLRVIERKFVRLGGRFNMQKCYLVVGFRRSIKSNCSCGPEQGVFLISLELILETVNVLLIRVSSFSLLVEFYLVGGKRKQGI
eukprot:1394633-Amorphochlora_amoeboformis.AAC.2